MQEIIVFAGPRIIYGAVLFNLGVPDCEIKFFYFLWGELCGPVINLSRGDPTNWNEIKINRSFKLENIPPLSFIFISLHAGCLR